MKKEITPKIKVDDKAEKEKLMILAKADSIKGEQLAISEDGLKTEDEIKKFALGDIDNPNKKYELYYKGIMKLMRKYLPKGKTNQKARSYVYEEKNTMLTRGRRKNDSGYRGADSRMAYISDIEDILNIITAWVIKRGTMYELYITLRDMNIAKGYGAPKTK